MQNINDQDIEKRTKEIFDEKLGEEVLDIKDYSKGVWQIVKRVETPSDRFIIKFAEGKFIFREKYGCENLSPIIPAPKEIVSAKDYIVQTYLEGEELGGLVLDEKRSESIYTELGDVLRKIHSVKTDNYGRLTLAGKGEYKTLKDYIGSWFGDRYGRLEQSGLLEKGQLENVLSYMRERSEFLETDKKNLLHFDFEQWNIKVKDDHVSGVFDFSDLASGPAAYDFARSHISHLQDGKFNHIIRGYGNIDLEEIKFFATIASVRLIPFYYDKGDEPEIEKRVDMLKDLINS